MKTAINAPTTFATNIGTIIVKQANKLAGTAGFKPKMVNLTTAFVGLLLTTMVGTVSVQAQSGSQANNQTQHQQDSIKLNLQDVDHSGVDQYGC